MSRRKRCRRERPTPANKKEDQNDCEEVMILNPDDDITDSIPPIQRYVVGKKFCIFCTAEVDVKPLSCRSGGGLSLSTTLEDLAAIGESQVEEKYKSLTCALCFTCFDFVHSAAETKKKLELIKSDLEERIGLLKELLTDSLNGGVAKELRLVRVMRALLKAYQNDGEDVIPHAKMQEQEEVKFENIVKIKEEPPEFNEHENTGVKAKRRRKSSSTTTTRVINLENLPLVFQFQGKEIWTAPRVKPEFGGTLPAPAMEPTKSKVVKTEPTASTRRSRRIKSEPLIDLKVDVDENLSGGDDDQGTQQNEQLKKKRKYTRRKPLKLKNELGVDDNGRDPLAPLPLFQSVKNEIGDNRMKGVNLKLLEAEDDKWLQEHVEAHPKGVILRSVLYRHFYDRCIASKRIPHNQATFGKLVKNVFNGLIGTRRLGGRGQSLYCHVGLRFKTNSPFNDTDVVEEYDIAVADTDTRIFARIKEKKIQSLPDLNMTGRRRGRPRKTDVNPEPVVVTQKRRKQRISTLQALGIKVPPRPKPAAFVPNPFAASQSQYILPPAFHASDNKTADGSGENTTACSQPPVPPPAKEKLMPQIAIERMSTSTEDEYDEIVDLPPILSSSIDLHIGSEIPNDLHDDIVNHLLDMGGVI